VASQQTGAFTALDNHGADIIGQVFKLQAVLEAFHIAYHGAYSDLLRRPRESQLQKNSGSHSDLAWNIGTHAALAETAAATEYWSRFGIFEHQDLQA